MTFSLSLDISPLALIDVRDTARVSGRDWGDVQQTKYVRALHAAFARICAFPEIGRQQDAISPGLRSFRVEMHVVFYRVYVDRILIVRVLHQRMDASKAIGEE